MTIRRFLVATAVVAALTPALCRAASVVLLYDGEAAVKEGRAWPAPAIETGAIVPAKTAMEAPGGLLIGDADGLYKGVLFRLDNDLNVAVVRRGDPVQDPVLLGQHLTRWTATAGFLSLSTGAADGSAFVPTASAPTGPFKATINGVATDSTVVLNERFNKAKFKLEVVNTSTFPVWGMAVRLTSDPKLSFWKEGRSKGLNDVPEPVLRYERQALFKPIRPGESVSVTAEAYFMKGKDYTWTVESKSKDLTSESKFAVRIE